MSTWAERAAVLDTVDDLARLWRDGAREIGLDEEGGQGGG